MAIPNILSCVVHCGGCLTGSNTYTPMKPLFLTLLGFLSFSMLASGQQIDVITHPDAWQYLQQERAIKASQDAADASSANAAATQALLEEQKRANGLQEKQRQAQLILEAKKLAEEQKQRQQRSDLDASSTGDGVSLNDPTASQLAWFYCIYVIQTLPNGVLANSFTPANNMQGYLRGGKLAFIEMNSPLEAGRQDFISAYKAGTYTYTDNSGKKRTVPRYVYKESYLFETMQYKAGSIKQL